MFKILSLITCLVLVSSQAWSANYSDPIDGVFKGVYGDTFSVEIHSEVSKSPVADENERGDLSFQFNANTGYKNFRQLSELKEGDPVRVDYDESGSKGKQLVATAITKLGARSESNTVEVHSTTAAPVESVTTTTTTTSY